MHLVVCVDDDGGTLFNGRRLSQDRGLRAWLLAYVAEQGSRLVASPYTAKQFAPDDPIVPSEQPLSDAAAGDFVFAEELDPTLATGRATSVLLVRWNRRYPHDRTFPESLFAGRTCQKVAEFAGSSHPCIAVERWS